MGEREIYQPLTRADKISVVIYRAGIVLSSLIIAAGAYLLLTAAPGRSETAGMILLLALYASTGMSVFFIHLYISKFHRGLKMLYFIALAALALLFVIGGGDAFSVLATRSYGPLFLLPLSGCLGFITAKEAFCFKLTEGYILALVMPLSLLFISARGLKTEGVSYGLVLIAALLLLFTFRKAFMPLHFDIGDKSAYS